MKLAPIANDVQRQVQATANIQSSYVQSPDFSRYLKTGTEDAGFSIRAPEGMDTEDIDAMAREMWGTAYDPATHTIRLDALTRNTQAATDAFARKLGGLLRGQGIDTEGRIDFILGQDGNLHVAGNHPQKFLMEAYFSENPALSQEYAKISEDNETVAVGKLSAELGRQWQVAQSDTKRQVVYNRFVPLFRQAQQLAGQMSLFMDMLASASLAYAAKAVHG